MRLQCIYTAHSNYLDPVSGMINIGTKNYLAVLFVDETVSIDFNQLVSNLEQQYTALA